MSVSVDEPGVGDVLPDVDDGNVVAGAGQDLVPGPDRGHRPSSMRTASATGGSSMRHDPPDEDEAPGPGRGVLGAAAVAGEPLADEVGDAGSWCCSERSP